jgi:hypothetical protein
MSNNSKLSYDELVAKYSPLTYAVLDGKLKAMNAELDPELDENNNNNGVYISPLEKKMGIKLYAALVRARQLAGLREGRHIMVENTSSAAGGGGGGGGAQGGGRRKSRAAKKRTIRKRSKRKSATRKYKRRT